MSARISSVSEFQVRLLHLQQGNLNYYMKERYLQGQVDVSNQDTKAVRPWRLLSGNGVEFLSIPTPDQVLNMLLKARDSRVLAESYRGFNVGASGLVISADGSDRLIKHGANFKDASGQSDIDIHAEELVLKRLRAGDKLAILAVVGYPQADHGSGLLSPTLHPCFKCRTMLGNSEHVADNTLVACATPSGDAVEWGTLNDFENFHRGQASNLTSVNFDIPPAIFTPLPPQQAYDLSNPSLDIDTSEWDARVTFPLLEWTRQYLR